MLFILIALVLLPISLIRLQVFSCRVLIHVFHSKLIHFSLWSLTTSLELRQGLNDVYSLHSFQEVQIQ